VNYTVNFASFFLGQFFGGGSVTEKTDPSKVNPDPSTINQDLVI
jgi:hypothetical protein